MKFKCKKCGLTFFAYWMGVEGWVLPKKRPTKHPKYDLCKCEKPERKE